MSVSTHFKTSGDLALQPTRTQTKIPLATCRKPAIGSYFLNYTTSSNVSPARKLARLHLQHYLDQDNPVAARAALHRLHEAICQERGAA